MQLAPTDEPVHEGLEIRGCAADCAGLHLVALAIEQAVDDQILVHIQTEHGGIDFLDRSSEFLHWASLRVVGCVPTGTLSPNGDIVPRPEGLPV